MKSFHVLYVEDSPTLALLVMGELKASGIVIRHEGTLADALEAMRTVVFDAVLLDLGLPDSPSDRTFDRVRAVNPLVPIVVLSGSPPAGEAHQEAASYLVKGAANAEDILHALVTACHSARRSATRRLRNKFNDAE